jgi:hypothetical protein
MFFSLNRCQLLDLWQTMTRSDLVKKWELEDQMYQEIGKIILMEDMDMIHLIVKWKLQDYLIMYVW